MSRAQIVVQTPGHHLGHRSQTTGMTGIYVSAYLLQRQIRKLGGPLGWVQQRESGPMGLDSFVEAGFSSPQLAPNCAWDPWLSDAGEPASA